jgi:hypothetical protein
MDGQQIACIAGHLNAQGEGITQPPALPSFTPVDLRALAH